MHRQASSDFSPDGNPAAHRRVRIRSVVYECLSKIDGGEHAPLEAYHSLHPDLMPELADALLEGTKKLRLLMDATRAADQTQGATTSGKAETTASELAPSHHPRIARYSIVREIGGGGQGTVFEAIHELTGRTVALKLMTSVSRNSLARFEREALAMAVLDHPGLVKIIDRGRAADGAYFLAMDFVAGQDLDQWVSRQEKGAIGRRAVVEVFRKAAAAISVAHEQRIVHRDLKPSNIRVDAFNEPHIVDFGLASLSDVTDRSLTTTGNIVGSIPWSSPEQAAGSSADLGPASDVYALGVLLYQSLTNQFPYSVDGPLHTVTRSICNVQPTDPRSLKHAPFGRPDAAITEIILNCLAKEPGQRPAHGGALAAALTAYLEGTYKAAPRRFSTRHKAVTAVALALGVVGAVAWSRTDHQIPTLVLELPHSTNSVGIDMVEVPPGTFTMGSSNRDPGHMEDEQAHKVHLTRGFQISRTEITREQYQRVMGALPKQISTKAINNLPVDFVSRDDAVKFCRKLSEMDGRDYRLPTEAEWEYACRSGTSGVFAGSGRVDDIAWYGGNSVSALHTVGTRAPNQWGLLDMHGNVSEWTADGYIAQLGTREARDPLRGLDTDAAVIRGGSANSDADLCRSPSREALEPDQQ